MYYLQDQVCDLGLPIVIVDATLLRRRMDVS